MADQTNAAYSYKGLLPTLLEGVKKSCNKMTLEIKDLTVSEGGFSLTAKQKTNWLSTNWPMTFIITAEKVESTFALMIQGASSAGSFTQSSNNSAKAQELLSLIKAYAPTST